MTFANQLSARLRDIRTQMRSLANETAILATEIEALELANSPSSPSGAVPAPEQADPSCGAFSNMTDGAVAAEDDVPTPKAQTNRNLKVLILEALTDAHARGKPGLTPKGIREYLWRTYKIDAHTSINAIAWQMWYNLHMIDKDTDSGLYSLLRGGRDQGEHASRADGVKVEASPVNKTVQLPRFKR